MEELEKLYNVLKRDGFYTKSFEEFQEQSEDPVYQERIYNVVSREKLFTKSKEEFVNKYFLKKKDDSLPTGEEEVMVSDTTVVEEPGSSEPSVPETEEVVVPEEKVDFSPVEEQEDVEVQKIQEIPNRTFADRVDQDPFAGQTVDFDYDESEAPTPIKEQDTAIERVFGKNEFTDFFGDIYRAGVQGQTQGATVDESLELMMKGGSASEEDVMAFIESYRAMQQSGPSEEMNSFNKIYQENGGGILGFIKGVYKNPTVVPQLFTSSVSAMINPTVLGAAVVGAAGGTLAGGPIGTIGGAMFAASTTLESALTFGELLEEALEGKPMTDENIRAVLEDPDKMRTIRAKAMGRGLAIGFIDGISGGLASKVTANVAKATAKAGKTTSRLTAAAAGGGVEVVGGSTGEVAGRLVAGQEMDIAEIGFEGIAGTATAPITVGYGLYKAAKNPPKYEVNGAPATRADIIEVLDSNDPEAIAGVNATIENDPELKNRLAKAKKDIADNAIIKRNLEEAGVTNQNDIDEMTALEEEAEKLKGNNTRAGKKRLAEINQRIDEILDKPSVEQEIDESIAVADKEMSAQATPRYKDNQVPVSRENYTVTNEDGTVQKYRVKINLDGSRQWEILDGDRYVPFNNGKIADKDVIQRDNLSTEQEIEGILSEGDSVTKEQTESYEQVMNPKMFDRLTPDQQRRVKGEPDKVQRPAREGDTQTKETESTQEEEKIVDGKVGDRFESNRGTEVIVKKTKNLTITESQTETVNPADQRNFGLKKTTKIYEQIYGDRMNGTEPVPKLNTYQNESVVTGRKTTQEQIQESQDLEALINESPVEVTSQETTEVTEDSPAPQREVNDNLNVVDQKKTDTYYKSERFNKENPNSNQQKHESMLMDRANKAIKAIQKILPNTKVILHRSEESYSQYIDTPSRGAFEPNTNTIHINMPKATGKTIAHEVLHAILKQKLGAEVNIQNASKNMVASVRKAIAKSKKLTSEQKAEFDTYADQFDSDVKNEEYLTNVVGFLAENYTKLDAPEKSAVKEFVQKIVDFVNEKFGTDINVADFTQSDRDVVDLLNAIAEKTTEGTEIAESDVQALDTFEGGKFVKNPSDALKTERLGNFEITYTQQDKIEDYLKDGRITQPKDLSSLEGMMTTITSPDDMMAGELKYKGKVIFEGEGGVFFVTKFGEVWASGKEGTANTIKNSLNKQIKSGQKKAYLTLTKGSDAKLVSSASGVNSTLEVLNLMLDNGIISPSVFRNSAIEAIKKERNAVIKKEKAKAKKDKVKYVPKEDKPISLRSSAKDLKSDIKKFFTDPTTSTFETRGNIVKEMVSSIIKNQDASSKKAINEFIGGDPSRKVGVGETVLKGGKKGQQSFVNLMAKLVAEKLTKGLSVGDVYAVIEVDGEVEVKESSHPSYPFHVVQKNGKPPVLILPQNREAGKDAFKPIYGTDEKTGEKLNNPYKVGNVSVMDGVFEKQTKKEKAPAKTEAFTKDDTVTFKVERQRLYSQTDKAYTFKTRGFGGKYVTVPKSQTKIREGESVLGAMGQDIGESGKRIEVNVPSWLFKRNPNLKDIRGFEIVEDKTKKATPKTEMFTPEKQYADIGMTEEQVQEWKMENILNIKMPHPKAAVDAAKNYADGNISLDEYNAIIKDVMPIKPYTEVPKVPTLKEIVMSLRKNKLRKGVVGLNLTIPDGTLIESRLDIPAYMDFGVYIDTLHNGEKKEIFGAKPKAPVGYSQVAVLNDVTFDSNPRMALKVAQGKQAKSPFAVMKGAYQNESTKSVTDRAKEAINSNEWTQVGFNPYRHAYFYDKANSKPVESAEQIIQVGPLVLAKGIKYGKPLEYVEKNGSPVKFEKITDDTTNDPMAEATERSEQKAIMKDATPEDVVKIGRDNNFSDAAIQDYLVRVKKMKVKDAKELLSLNADLFSKMPPSFGNMKGGAKAGLNFFKKVNSFMESLKKRNKKSKDPLTKAEMMDQTIEYMETQPEYQAEGTSTTVESDQQKQMVMDLQKALQVNPTKNMNTRIRKMRSDIRERSRGKRDLQKTKAQLRNFMRQALPKDVYTKSDVMSMVRKITNATEKNIMNLMDEVFDFVTERQVKSLTSKIDSILNGTYEIVQSGRRKGTKIDSDTRERLEAIRDAVSDDAMVADDIIDSNIKLNKEFNELSQKDIQTDADRNRMADILTIMAINNSKLMDNTDINKVESLSRAESILSGIIGEGRQTLKDQMAKDHKRYIKEFELLYEDVTGEKIDMSSEESVAQMKKASRSLSMKRAKRRTEKLIPRVMRKIMLAVSGFLNAAESLNGLMDKISTLPGDLFGGRAKKLVYDKVNESSIIYKRRMMEAQTALIDKVKEVYGKKWQSISKKNAAPFETGVLNSDGEQIILSPNQIGYLWMQYQDPANLPSFENENNAIFGKDHARIMKELVEAIDPKVIELAQWQQNEFFPSLYEHYNDSYKKIYRTNLPWNKHYGGRIYREGVSPDPLDLLGDKSKLNNQVGAASTKVRQKNSNPIQPMDMMDSLQTYLTDMEWFAAYGPNIRDINKLFGNPMMRKAIIDVHGESTMMLIDDAIKKIASRGIQSTRKNAVINAMNNVFVLSRLGINPTVMLKQLTSIPTYANDIGIVNYLKYSFKNIGSMMKVYKEIRDNSVYMQDRGFTDVRKVIESYSDKQMQSFVPNQTKNWFINAMMYFTKFGDRAAIFIGGMPNYSYYKDQALKQGMTEQEAIEYAIKKFENDTKNTQQSSDLQDKDYYQTSDPITRSFNMFLTTPKQYLRKEISSIRNLYRKIKAMDRKAGKGTVGQNLRQFAMYHFAMPMLFQYVAMGLPGILRDRREGDEEDLARAAIIGNLNALFIVGDLFNTAGDLWTGKPWAASPKSIALLETSATFTRLIERIQKTKNPEKKAELSNKLFLEAVSLSGFPAANLNKLSKNYQELIDGGEDPGTAILRLFNFSDYVIEGPRGKVKRPTSSDKVDFGGADFDGGMFDDNVEF